MELPNWFGQVLAAGGGGAAVSFLLFRYFGESWIKHRLDKRLEAAKAEISFHAATRLRFHEKEYEVLPETWARLDRARLDLGQTFRVLRTIIDVSSLKGTELEKWLRDNKDLSELEREQLENAPPDTRSKLYDSFLDRHYLSRSNESYWDFRNYLDRNKIFLNPETKTAMLEIAEMLREIWADASVALKNIKGEVNYERLVDAERAFKKTLIPMINDLELLIQRQLFPETVS